MAQARATIADVRNVERVTIDAPAHGASADSTVPLNFGDFAEAVLHHLDELDIDTAILGGISMGAGIALRIACDFPDRVTALVLVRPAWTDRPGRPHLDIVSDIGTWITEASVEVARSRLEADHRYQAMSANEPLAATSVARAIGGVAESGRPDVLTQMVDSRPVHDLALLANVHQPALVVSTERDELHPPSIAREIAAMLPNSTLAVAPPRYAEPVAHQEFLTKAINSFIDSDRDKKTESTEDRT